MKKKLLVSSLLILTLLTSCDHPELRSDIKEFIASFSLENAVSEYLNAGYVKTRSIVENGVTTTTVEDFSFNVTDALHPQYEKSIITYVDGVEILNQKEYIYEKDDIFIYHKMDNSEQYCSLEDAHKLVEKYFYTSTQLDGTIHLGGMYYGDYCSQTAISFQNFITINQEDSLYVFHATLRVEKDLPEPLDEEQTYEVNKVGMLVRNSLSQKTASKSVFTYITTYKI